jgi:hypothetical protein
MQAACPSAPEHPSTPGGAAPLLDWLRFASALPPCLDGWALLVVARLWTCPVWLALSAARKPAVQFVNVSQAPVPDGVAVPLAPWSIGSAHVH